ncbi:MAG: fibronectin type III domain-containing protein [Betaproteobacteria bacterium]
MRGQKGNFRRGGWHGAISSVRLLLTVALFSTVPSVTAFAASSGAGQTLWNQNINGQNACADCHGGTPSGARANAANQKTIFNTAISNAGGMGIFANGGAADLSEDQKDSIVLYLETVFDTTPLNRTTSFETAINIDVSGDVVLSTSISNLTTLVTGANVPNNGSVSYNNSLRRITYTPNGGFVGNDTFTYRARNSNDSLSTSERTVTVTVNPPPVPVITSSLSKSGTVGLALSYTITASNGPNSFNASGLPPGLARSGAVISGTPTTFNSADPSTISASNEGGAGPNATLTFNIAKGNPNPVIPVQSPSSQFFRPNTTFTINPLATSPSPGVITYSVSPASVCTVSGTTITKVGVGSCSIVANQAVSTNWLADTSPARVVQINQATQVITFPVQNPDFYPFVFNSTFAIDPATASGGSGNPVVYSSLTTGICTVSGTTVTMKSAGDCTLAANQAGNANYSVAIQATRVVVLSAGEPDAPVITAAIGGDLRATVVFTPPANPGSPITGYTVTCSLGGGTPKVGTGTASPIVVTGLSNGPPWSCNMTATNAIGTSVTSNGVGVNPITSAVPIAPVMRSANNVTFTIGQPSSFQVVATGISNPTLFTFSTPPTGITFSTVGQIAATGLLAGTPALGTAGTFNLTFSASNGTAPQANQAFTLTIAKANQAITFADPANRTYSPSTFALSASASSSLAVTFTSSTATICTVTSPGVVTMLAAGTCTITAAQAGDANYNAAPLVPQSFDISKASQSISWGAANVLPDRVFVAGASFALTPLATVASGLPIAYASLTLPKCTISGTTVTMVSAGICTVEASQDGNAAYQVALDVSRNFNIDKGLQIISFPAQAAQPFVDGGTFAISPPATGGLSGNPIVYTSLSANICTVTNGSVNIISAGTCQIAANQSGDSNYSTASQVSRNIAINVVVPGAPTADSAVGSDGKATIEVSPPSSDGGSPITGYSATCNPGNFTGNSADSPVVVTGLANGVLHTCRVVAVNAVGSSVQSNAINVTPFLDSGLNMWTNACSSCHGVPPTGTRFNAAGDTSTILQYVRSAVVEMVAQPVVQALTANELAEIAKYIKQQVPAISVQTAYQTAKQVDVAFPNHITLNSQAMTFTGVQAVTQPTNGTLSVFTGTTVTYTPNPGYAGPDTFTYRGFRTGPNLQGEARTVSITVQQPAAQSAITSSGTANGVVGQLFQYLITATNGPASFSAGNLPPGTSINTGTGLISGTASTAGVFNATISATNPNPNPPVPASLVITISKAGQSISFGAQASQQFSPGASFAISPTATASSGLAVSYGSLTPTACTVAGTTVTKVTSGTCTITANQPGNANINAALQVTQDVSITAVAPGAPVIGAATPGDQQAAIAFTAPASNGGSAITSYSATCAPTGSGSNAVSPVTVTGLTNGVQYTCSVSAINAAGTGSASGTVMVTPTATPVAPLITSATSTTFNVLSAGNFTVTASGTPAPARSATGSLPAGVTFTGGTGVLAGTPASGTAGSYPLTVSAMNGSGTVMQSFTLTVAKANQSINFANPGARSFSVTPFVLSATATSGLTVIFTSNTASVCTVSGSSVTTLTTGVCSISADVAANVDYNVANTVTQGFNINAASQAITFGAQVTPIAFSMTPFAISPPATSSSALAVIHSSTTPAVCTVSGTTVTMVTAGTCTLAANQPGDSNFAAATQVTRNITITATAPGAPLIGVATGSDVQASIAFAPPASNGGSPITQYNASCSPSGTGSSGASPVVVASLLNGTQYTCTVSAVNAVGPGPASGPVTVTPTSANGQALWGSICANCHGPVPVGNQFNGAGNTATVLNHVRSTQPLMSGAFGATSNSIAVQALSQAELAALAAYIGNVLPANTVITPFNIAAPIDVSGHIKLTNHVTGPDDNWSAFTAVEVVTAPAHGMLSAFSGTSATYTPTPGYSGPDSFTYRGKRSSPSVLGDARTVSITIGGAPPVITSAGTINVTFGQAVNYQITASNTPTGFDATGLPTGLGVNAGTGAITGTPLGAGTANATISASNAGGSGNAALVITVAKAAQAITFGAQATPRSFGLGSFVISPLATGGSSGNPISYSSLTTATCTVNATTVSIVSAGLCTIAADQEGNGNFNAAPQVTRNVTITSVVPAAPLIGVGVAGDSAATISFTPPASDGGSALSFTAICNPGSISSAAGPASPLTVTGLTNGTPYTCSVKATNSAGTGPPSATVAVTPGSLAFTGIVVSRKAHGVSAQELDVDIANPAEPIDGNVTVEPRSIGGGHRIAFRFDGPVSNVMSVTAVDSALVAVGSPVSAFVGNELIVTLTNIADRTRVMISLVGVNGSVDASATIGFMVGDISGSRSVNAVDIAMVKAHLTQTVNASNFYMDIDANGTINNADLAAVKARSGLALP